ncbi:MAG: Verru_Chthon cassette protein A [Verrucomicrobiaceae bacterium]|nr:Verru_Chthon cassette protein A [Verrucomicrobiaceae bacterium]
MKEKIIGLFRKNDRRGLALVSVLSLVTLATILVMALFTVSEAEYKASTLYADGNAARHLADSAVNIVINQIQSAATGVAVGGATRNRSGGAKVIWASQPGAVRTYSAGGGFLEGRKLYSSSQMVTRQAGAAGETAFTKSDQLDSDWDRRPDEWTDLNAPVVKVTHGTTGSSGSVGGTPSTNVIFPVLDPRSYAEVEGSPGQAPDDRRVEGFSISSEPPDYASDSNTNVTGVNVSGGTDDWRVPLPVRWLYVLQDGTVGTMAQTPGGSANWVGGGGPSPTQENPIVGRIAFWTDDESTKININTAGEPALWELPLVYHKRDYDWANNQPVVAEYQRYPGHPATVALSTVLLPSFAWDTFPKGSTTGNNYDSEGIAYKNRLYEMLPKLGPGGTQDGSRSFDIDAYSSSTSSVIDNRTWQQMTSEKLNISLDEFAFEKKLSQGRRRLGELSSPSGDNLLNPGVINRNRFFLSAHSRAPETNMFGYPRIAMWPLPDASLGPLYRTSYDTAIQMAATLGEASTNNTSNVGNLYAFSRVDSRSSTADGLGGTTAGTARNRDLMRYLDELINHQMPGAGGSGGKFGTTAGKYSVGPLGGSDARQIIVQIFDYIRCTNLFDARLYKRTIENFGLDLFDPPGYNIQRDSVLVHNKLPDSTRFLTYTEPRFRVIRRGGDVYNIPTNRRDEFAQEEVVTGAYPGHGQVTPIDWVFPGETFTYKGFGRFPTISEVALHFICTADGLTSDYSYIARSSSGDIRSGGKVAMMLDPKVQNIRRPDSDIAAVEGIPEPRWYSNIPPFPTRVTMENWGLDFARIGSGGSTDPMRHPAWRARNWNVTLDRDTPLQEYEKRIQVAIQFETFVPSAGWTKYVPDWTIVMDGESVSNLKVRDSGGRMVPLFETTEDLVLQSNEAYVGGDYRGMREGTDTYPIGGAYGTTALMNGRSVRAIGEMPADQGFTADASSAISGAMRRFPFVSNFVTVKRTEGFIEFENGGQTIETATPLKVAIYPSHDWQGVRDKRGSIPVQTFDLAIPGGRVPMPSLVVHSSEWVEYIDASGNRWEQQAVPAVRWWSFNRGGAVNQYRGNGNVDGVDDPKTLWRNIEPTTDQDKSDLRTHGRLLGQAHTTIQTFLGNRTNPVFTSANNVPVVTAVSPEPRTLNRTGRTITGGNIYGFSSADAFSGTRASVEHDNPSAEHDTKTGGFLGGNNGNYQWWGSDSIRSIVPRHGDYRIVAAMKHVPASMWMKHPVWVDRENALFAHSLTGFSSASHPGVDFGGKTDPNWANPRFRLVPQKWYPQSQVPDIPLRKQTMEAVTRYGDFDNGVGVMRDGAYINKPDDGNLSVMGFWVDGDIRRVRNAYFYQSWIQTPLAGDFFGPNRLMPSPGMLGSLPTGVFGSNPVSDTEAASAGVPWRTLLFRPSIAPILETEEGQRTGIPHTGRGQPGMPADHLFMDLFWMPLVDPRPYSYGCATEGKININFQIMPFRHVIRSTGVHAVLKGEFVTAINSTLASRTGGQRLRVETHDVSRPDLTLFYKREKTGGQTYPERFWQETDVQFHQPINAARTLSIMHHRFKATTAIGQMSHVGLFRTASEFTEVHLVPDDSIHYSFDLPKKERDLNGNTYSQVINKMRDFWFKHSLTGDNAKERPYTNIYQKITTKSNVFRIYFKSQTIKKAKSLPPNELDTTKDTVTAEYQGSALIERYLDFKNDVYPDYAKRGLSELSLENFYRYRVIDMKQFAF